MVIISESMVIDMEDEKMVQTKYGNMAASQVGQYSKNIQKMIFWCLIYADPQTAEKYREIDVVDYLKNTMRKIAGFNAVMLYPKELLGILATLESALQLLESSDYNFQEYRRLILDAGALAGRLKVGE